MEREALAKSINKLIRIRYLNQRSELNDYTLVLLGLDQGWTEGDNQHRIYLSARDVNEDTRTAKSFLYHRILELFDGQTGEIVTDIPKYLSELISENGGQLPREWPKQKIYIRDVKPTFDSNGFAENWKFGVPKVFAGSLDIIFRKLRASEDQPAEIVMLQGCPVELQLRRGDVFYQPPHLSTEQWGEWLQRGFQVLTVEKGTDNLGITEVMIREVDKKQKTLKRGKRHLFNQKKMLDYLEFAIL